MAVDAMNIWKYTENDSVSSWPEFLNLATNSVSNALKEWAINFVHVAHSLEDMEARKNTLSQRGVTGSSSRPLVFYRSDQGVTWRWNGQHFYADGQTTGRINIDGRTYMETSNVAASSVSLSSLGSGVWGGTCRVTVPAAAPSGWAWKFDVWIGRGFTVVSNNSAGPLPNSPTQYQVRIIQFGSGDVTALTNILCTLVKI